METRTETKQTVAKQGVATDQAKAKAKAQAGLVKNIPTLKDIKQPVTKPEKQAEPKKEKKPTFADALDAILLAGGKWADMVAKATEAATEHKVTTKANKGILRAHAQYRIKHNAEYLKGMIMSETGIEKLAKTGKK